MDIYRQGDITFIPVKGLPGGTYEAKSRKGIIAIGEATGHKHWVETGKANLHEDIEGNLYIEFIEDAVIIHSGPDNKPATFKSDAAKRDLHLQLNIKKGIYRVNHERDYDPFQEIEFRVLD